MGLTYENSISFERTLSICIADEWVRNRIAQRLFSAFKAYKCVYIAFKQVVRRTNIHKSCHWRRKIYIQSVIVCRAIKYYIRGKKKRYFISSVNWCSETACFCCRSEIFKCTYTTGMIKWRQSYAFDLNKLQTISIKCRL